MPWRSRRRRVTAGRRRRAGAERSPVDETQRRPKRCRAWRHDFEQQTAARRAHSGIGPPHHAQGSRVTLATPEPSRSPAGATPRHGRAGSRASRPPRRSRARTAKPAVTLAHEEGAASAEAPGVARARRVSANGVTPDHRVGSAHHRPVIRDRRQGSRATTRTFVLDNRKPSGYHVPHGSRPQTPRRVSTRPKDRCRPKSARGGVQACDLAHFPRRGGTRA